MSCEDFTGLLDSGLVNILDIREPDELEISSLAGSINIPMMLLEDQVDELSKQLKDSEVPTVVVCRSGARSEMVTGFLIELGFDNVFNLTDGINGLSKLRAGIKSY